MLEYTHHLSGAAAHFTDPIDSGAVTDCAGAGASLVEERLEALATIGEVTVTGSGQCVCVCVCVLWGYMLYVLMGLEYKIYATTNN